MIYRSPPQEGREGGNKENTTSSRYGVTSKDIEKHLHETERPAGMFGDWKKQRRNCLGFPQL